MRPLYLLLAALSVSSVCAAPEPESARPEPSSPEEPTLTRPVRSPAVLTVVDRHGGVALLDEAGAVLSTVAGHATDVIANEALVATFEPATDEADGLVRVFTTEGDALAESASYPTTVVTGGLLHVGDGVLGWSVAEAASLFVVDANGSGGLTITEPSSVRTLLGEDGSRIVECLVPGATSPRVDLVRLSAAGGLRGTGEVSVFAAAEARLGPGDGRRLVVSVDAAALVLAWETGPSEVVAEVALGSTLEGVATRGDTIAILLASPPRLVLRAAEGRVEALDLPGAIAWDPRPSHRIALTAEAVWIASPTALLRVATGTSPLSAVLVGDGTAAVVALPASR